MQAPKYKLTLYVTPDSSGKALAHLYTALSDLSYTDYQLEIVDVLKDSDKARKAGIVHTPVLVYHAAKGDYKVDKVHKPAVIQALLRLKE